MIIVICTFTRTPQVMWHTSARTERDIELYKLQPIAGARPFET